MTNLIQQARSEKRLQEKKKKEEQVTKEKSRRVLRSRLANMKELVLVELKKLDGKKASGGVFRLRVQKEDNFSVFAVLSCGNRKMGWFKAQIVSGTVDMSDDVRNVPYTDPVISGKVYPLHGRWPSHGFNVQELDGDGPNLWVSDSSQMKEFFEKFSKLLADWC